VRFAETDAVVVVAVAADDDAAATWTEWSGASKAFEKSGETFLGATLHSVTEPGAKYTHVVRVELGNVADDVVEEVVEEARTKVKAVARSGSSFRVEPYRCAFNIEKKGTPAGALPAVREMQKKQRENEKEKALFDAKRDASEKEPERAVKSAEV
jgi:hypothetical protein